jgi:hypothetical protein
MINKLISFIVIAFLLATTFSPVMASALTFEKLYQEDISLTAEEHGQLRTLVRSNPSKAIKELSLLVEKNQENGFKKLNYLYELLTIAHFCVGELDKASEYNQRQLENFQKFPYNFIDSLDAYSNRMILFFTFDSHVDALETAINLDKRIRNFEYSADLHYLYRKLAYLYAMVDLPEESYAFSHNILNRMKKSDENYYRADFNFLIAKRHLDWNNLDSAEYYCTKALEYANYRPEEVKRYYGLLGEIYFKNNNTDKAFSMYNKAYQEFIKYPEVMAKASLMANYSNLLLRSNHKEKAPDVLIDTYNILREINVSNQIFQYDLLTIEIAIILINQEPNRELPKIISQRDSLAQHLFNLREKQILRNINAKYQLELKDLSIKTLEEEDRRKTSEIRVFYYTLVFIGVIIVLLILMIIQQRKSAKVKNQLLLIEKEKMEKEIEVKQREKSILESKNLQLKENLSKSSKRLEKQNALFSRLDEIILSIKESHALNPEIERVITEFNHDFREFSSGIFEEDMVANFKGLNSEKHQKLIDILEDEKSSEYLYAVLLILNFSNREIAISLRKTQKAISSIRYRLRKKLNLDEEVDLVEYLQKL